VRCLLLSPVSNSCTPASLTHPWPLPGRPAGDIDPIHLLMLDDLRPAVALDKLAQLVELREGLEYVASYFTTMCTAALRCVCVCVWGGGGGGCVTAGV
jgi:hypothetical protein